MNMYDTKLKTNQNKQANKFEESKYSKREQQRK